MADPPGQQPKYVSITPLLKRLSFMDAPKTVKAEEVAAAISLIFTNSISPVQFGCMLYALHVTEGDHDPRVLSHCAKAMREAAVQMDGQDLADAVRRRGHAKAEGQYRGGLVSISFDATTI